MAWAAYQAAAAPVLAAQPEGVEASARLRADHRGKMLINCANADCTAVLPAAGRDLLTETATARVVLKPYGVAVLDDGLSAQ